MTLVAAIAVLDCGLGIAEFFLHQLESTSKGWNDLLYGVKCFVGVV